MLDRSQLCINFANEKLQQFFLMCVFKEEEALHIKEGVPWKDIEFQDNAGCIMMLEKPPSALPADQNAELEARMHD